jgi:ubiquinol-cytochrome c reductase iron-sulfur subunit
MKGRPIIISLTVSAAASVGLAVAFIAGGNNQVQGVLLAAALAGIGVALVMWAHTLGEPEIAEERTPLATPPDPEPAPELPDSGPSRRSFVGWLAAAIGALAVALLAPIRSLGRSPDLRHTKWAAGIPLVDSDGNRVHLGELEVGGVATVFPEGHPGDAISQALLLRVDPQQLQPLPGREDWSPDGYIVFSKVCTHAGCPVGLFEHTRDQLLCPCHQSTFDVLAGAKPVFGPAPRPLPQLPIEATADGALVAQSDFHEPIGPGFWNRGR